MSKIEFIVKITKTLLAFSILVFFLLSVDFSDLSFKTVLPEPTTKIDKSSENGVIRNLKNDEYGINEKFFEGNEQNIIDLVNQSRKEEGLEFITPNEKLSLSAMDKAQHMKDGQYFDHVSPQGLQPWYFAQKRNYEYKNFGENLAEGYFSAESVHEGWMNSEGHRKNILSKNFEEIGVAILEFQQEGQKSYLIVQHFGSQLTPSDLVTEIVCDKKSQENCEEAEDEENKLDDLIEEQEKIIKKAEKDGVSEKELNRLEENLENLEEADDEIEDYLEECEKFLKKCDRFE